MCRNWMGFTPKIRKQQRRCDCDCITSTYQAWRCDSKADTKQLMGYDHPIWRRRGSLVSIDPSMSRFLVEVSCVAAAPSSSDSGFCMHTLVALAAGPIWLSPSHHFYFVGRTNLPFWVCSRPACCLIFFLIFRFQVEVRRPTTMRARPRVSPPSAAAVAVTTFLVVAASISLADGRSLGPGSSIFAPRRSAAASIPGRFT